jgi:hypothetical protein
LRATQRRLSRSLLAAKEQTTQEGSHLMHRVAFTGAALLALVAAFGGYVSYYHLAVKVGDYDVPALAGWIMLGLFGLISLMLLRWSHAGSHS